MTKVRIYLDDVRTPVDPSWVVVRSYDEFVQKINTIGMENIELISLDLLDLSTLLFFVGSL
jgi:hypothetical protein